MKNYAIQNSLKNKNGRTYLLKINKFSSLPAWPAKQEHSEPNPIKNLAKQSTLVHFFDSMNDSSYNGYRI